MGQFLRNSLFLQVFHKLFTMTQRASIPPLAIAFLVGYAVDGFFSSLEGLLQTFNRSRVNAGAPAEPAVMVTSHK